MDATIIKFEYLTKSRWYGNIQDVDRYLGSVTAKRSDGAELRIDLYATAPSTCGTRMWNPKLKHVSDSATDYCYMDGLSEDVNATRNQWAFFYLRKYLQDNWWCLLNNGTL